MKLPLAPPNWNDLLKQMGPERFACIMPWLQRQVGVSEDYWHWDQLRHRPPPEGWSHEVWWFVTKLERRARPLLFFADKMGRAFTYAQPDVLLSLLHGIDRDASGEIRMESPITNPATRDGYLVNALIEEAITSSQLEGASTTRQVAKDMLHSGRSPRTRDERMIVNNYRAMEFVREQKDTALSQALILELHRIVCEGTLDNAMAAGRLRRPDEDVHVVDNGDGTILHTPPPAEELVERLERLCRFANDRSDSGPYLHPVVRAVLIHFMIGYDHPFVDGNGRTARALFYWSMARQGYWLMEYVPISRLIKKAPSQYSRAYLYTETDDNDATYFILHQLRIIRRAIDDLHVYLARRGAELRTVEQVLRRSRRWRDQLNHRQISLLEHALRHPGAQYLIAAHGRAHRVTNGTANADLRHLARQGLLEQTRHGRAFVFIAPPDLEELLKSSG